MPKVSRCITNVKEQTAYCVNGYGTEYEIKFTDAGTGKDGDRGFDKQICMPGQQFVDSVAWVKELLTILTQEGTKKK